MIKVSRPEQHFDGIGCPRRLHIDLIQWDKAVKRWFQVYYLHLTNIPRLSLTRLFTTWTMVL